MYTNSFTRQFKEDAKQEEALRRCKGQKVISRYAMCDYLRKYFGTAKRPRKSIGPSNGNHQSMGLEELQASESSKYHEEIDSIENVEGRIIYALIHAGYNMREICHALKVRYNVSNSNPLLELIKVVQGKLVLKSKTVVKEVVSKRERIIVREVPVEKMVNIPVEKCDDMSIDEFIQSRIFYYESIGISYTEMAKTLGVSIRTIRNYRSKKARNDTLPIV